VKNFTSLYAGLAGARLTGPEGTEKAISLSECAPRGYRTDAEMPATPSVRADASAASNNTRG
jgi:hypothetical protein